MRSGSETEHARLHCHAEKTWVLRDRRADAISDRRVRAGPADERPDPYTGPFRLPPRSTAGRSPLSQNDYIALSIGEVGSDAGFNPWIRLRNPNGVEIGSAAGASSRQINVTASLSGTYTVLVASGDTGNDGVGSYRLTLAQAPGAFVVAGGDEGGPMTNGADHQGSLYVG